MTAVTNFWAYLPGSNQNVRPSGYNITDLMAFTQIVTPSVKSFRTLIARNMAEWAVSASERPKTLLFARVRPNQLGVFANLRRRVHINFMLKIFRLSYHVGDPTK